MPGKRSSAEREEQGKEKETKQKKAKAEKAEVAALKPEFELANYIEKTQQVDASMLALDKAPEFPYGQVRAVQQDKVESIMESLLKNPPTELDLTVWHNRGVPPLHPLSLLGLKARCRRCMLADCVWFTCKGSVQSTSRNYVMLGKQYVHRQCGSQGGK